MPNLLLMYSLIGLLNVSQWVDSGCPSWAGCCPSWAGCSHSCCTLQPISWCVNVFCLSGLEHLLKCHLPVIVLSPLPLPPDVELSLSAKGILCFHEFIYSLYIPIEVPLPPLLPAPPSHPPPPFLSSLLLREGKPPVIQTSVQARGRGGRVRDSLQLSGEPYGDQAAHLLRVCRGQPKAF